MASKVFAFPLKRSTPLGAVVALVMAVTYLIMHPVSVAAADGRDFAGNYSLSEVSQSGDVTTLTLSMRIFNYSGSDVGYATVIFEDSDHPGVVYAAFSSVGVTSDDSVPLSATATLPTSEVERWSQGSSPAIKIQFTDIDGLKRDERVEVAPMPSGQ
jgi:hypothetical protein